MCVVALTWKPNYCNCQSLALNEFQNGQTAALDFATTEHDEEQLASFVQAWEEYEAWTLSVVEHLGPLDLEVSRERTHNLQHGRSHTPYSADLCRLAFRNFAVCEGQMFFALAMTVYGLIAASSLGQASERGQMLLETVASLAKAYGVQDDALAAQRSTLHEFRYYLLEPLQRVFAQDSVGGAVGDMEDSGDEVRDAPRRSQRARGSSGGGENGIGKLSKGSCNRNALRLKISERANNFL